MTQTKMFPSAALLTTLLIWSVTAKPLVVSDRIVKLTLQRHINVTRARNLLRHDQTRARYFYGRAQALVAGVSALENDSASTKRSAGPTAIDFDQPIVNSATIYTATIGVGNPPTDYNLIIDTGSSNTWIGNNKAYIPTKTTVQTYEWVHVTYGSGFFSGHEYLDWVTLTDGLIITNQSIGVAWKTNGFFDNYDGILGIGPVELTRGTLLPLKNKTVPTVTDNAFSLHNIKENQVGIYFAPAATEEDGELTWGGVDTEKLASPLNFAPITTKHPSSLFWGIDQDITYGQSTIILSSAAGVVDTGTTLVLLAPDAFHRYVNATGAVFDIPTGLLVITEKQFLSLKPLFFNINGVSYELTPNAQVWPRSLNTFAGGKPDSIYLIVGNLGLSTGGLDFIIGYTFLERFYTVYDTTNKRIGFARTRFTNATSN
ncbi:Polyporopepsin [Termitomyces sp. T112]|nr:Polyporopepsin [Termitomyces sp. T112]